MHRTEFLFDVMVKWLQHEICKPLRCIEPQRQTSVIFPVITCRIPRSVYYQIEDVQHPLVSDFLCKPFFQNAMVNALEKVPNIHLEDIFAILPVCPYPLSPFSSFPR